MPRILVIDDSTTLLRLTQTTLEAAGYEVITSSNPISTASYLRQHQPEFILLQCGADSIKGDPITNMEFSPAAHAYAAASLCKIADECCQGRLLGMGGGGYNHDNLAQGWTAVVNSMIKS